MRTKSCMPRSDAAAPAALARCTPGPCRRTFVQVVASSAAWLDVRAAGRVRAGDLQWLVLPIKGWGTGTRWSAPLLEARGPGTRIAAHSSLAKRSPCARAPPRHYAAVRSGTAAHTRRATSHVEAPSTGHTAAGSMRSRLEPRFGKRSGAAGGAGAQAALRTASGAAGPVRHQPTGPGATGPPPQRPTRSVYSPPRSVYSPT